LGVISKLVERTAAHLVAEHLERLKVRGLHDGQFALSTLEVEYIESAHATRESLWIRRILQEVAATVSINISKASAPIGCGNQGAVELITPGAAKQKSKHIDVKYHVHDEQAKGSIQFR